MKTIHNSMKFSGEVDSFNIALILIAQLFLLIWAFSHMLNPLAEAPFSILLISKQVKCESEVILRKSSIHYIFKRKDHVY